MKTRVARSLAGDGAILVRIPVDDASWADLLPPAPAGRTLTVSVGHPVLVPAIDTLEARGYRFAGVVDPTRLTGHSVDVMIPADVRTQFPDLVTTLMGMADRVFDLRMGPVMHVLAAELALHRSS
ncbi:MAG: hypothetical protein WD575_02280 [Nitriliruptoraceae bacterium]